MNRRVLWFVTVPLVGATLAFAILAAYFAIDRSNHERQREASQKMAEAAAQASAASGSDFLVQGRSVVATLFVPKSVRRGDSLSVVLSLKPGAPGGTAGLGNEHDGVLTPVLTVADCEITPAQALPKVTGLPIAAFVWDWSVDACRSAGDKAVQLSLLFTRSGAGNGSDPVAYRGLAYVEVTDPFSWETATQILGVITAALTAASIVAGFFQKSATGSEKADA